MIEQKWQHARLVRQSSNVNVTGLCKCYHISWEDTIAQSVPEKDRVPPSWISNTFNPLLAQWGAAHAVSIGQHHSLVSTLTVTGLWISFYRDDELLLSFGRFSFHLSDDFSLIKVKNQRRSVRLIPPLHSACHNRASSNKTVTGNRIIMCVTILQVCRALTFTEATRAFFTQVRFCK